MSINKFTIMSAPMTSVSIISAFGDIKNFPEWSATVIEYYRLAIDTLFYPFAFIGLGFTEWQRGILVVLILVYLSNYMSVKATGSEYFNRRPKDTKGKPHDIDFLKRPLYTIDSYTSKVYMKVCFVVFLIATLILDARYQEELGVGWVISSLIFYTITFLVLTTLITNTWVSYFVPKRLFARALILKDYARQVRRLFVANEIGQKFKDTELVYIENGFVQVRLMMEMARRLTMNTATRVAYILANLAVIFTAFTMILRA